jgi:hypothetical protein
LIAQGSAVIAYSGSSRYDIVDINTLNLTSITTNANQTRLQFHQQIAGNPALNLAMATSSGTSGFTLVSLTCCANLQPAGLAGGIPHCIITKPDTNTWLIGTTGGRIHEVNSSGTILTTVSVPSSNFFNTGPTIFVTTLSYYASTVLASTDSGELLSLNWPSGTVNYRFPMFSIQSTFNTQVLTSASSGTCLLTSNSAVAYPKGVSEVYFERGFPTVESNYFNETNSGICTAGIEPSGAYAWAIFSSTNFLQFRLYNLTSTSKALVNTESQDPIGTDIISRIIRIRVDGPIGSANVEIDQSTSPGVNAISCTNSRNYIELALEGAFPSYTKWDIREMQA